MVEFELAANATWTPVEFKGRSQSDCPGEGTGFVAGFEFNNTTDCDTNLLIN